MISEGSRIQGFKGSSDPPQYECGQARHTTKADKPGYPKGYMGLQELFFIFKEVITDSINYLFEFRCSESQNLAEKF